MPSQCLLVPALVTGSLFPDLVPLSLFVADLLECHQVVKLYALISALRRRSPILVFDEFRLLGLLEQSLGVEEIRVCDVLHPDEIPLLRQVLVVIGNQFSLAWDVTFDFGANSCCKLGK